MDHRTLSIPLACNEAVSRLSAALQQAGFRVERSFDLQSARAALRVPSACPCPHHGTAECSCQYVVMLVARDGGAPLSLVAHGQEQHTLFSFEPGTDNSGAALAIRTRLEGFIRALQGSLDKEGA